MRPQTWKLLRKVKFFASLVATVGGALVTIAKMLPLLVGSFSAVPLETPSDLVVAKRDMVPLVQTDLTKVSRTNRIDAHANQSGRSHFEQAILPTGI